MDQAIQLFGSVDSVYPEVDVRRRVRSDRFTSLLAVVECAQEPQVKFDFVATSRGLDYVAEVRAE